VADPHAQIKFDAPAVLRKWPSLNKGRISNATPYFIVEGSLDECIRELPASLKAPRLATKSSATAARSRLELCA